MLIDLLKFDSFEVKRIGNKYKLSWVLIKPNGKEINRFIVLNTRNEVKEYKNRLCIRYAFDGGGIISGPYT